MALLNANGTAVTFPTSGDSIANLISVTNSRSGEEIDVTNMASTVKEWEVGITDHELTLKVIGFSHPDVIYPGLRGDIGIAYGASGAGGTDALADAIVVSVNSTGSTDTRLETDIKIKHGHVIV